MAADVRTCASCGLGFERRRRVSDNQWRARRFCSRRCYWASMSTPSAAKTCGHCGGVFARPKERSDAVWARRIYCSRSCAFAARRANEEERFWAKVDRRGPDDCWPWIGAAQDDVGGRGRFKVNGRRVYAYRLAYEYLVGPLPAGTDLHHGCETPACVNPAHVEPLTTGAHSRLTHAGISHDFGGPHPDAVSARG